MNSNRYFNESAEASVLGAILLKNDVICDVDLQPGDFYLKEHRIIFAEMLKLYSMSKAINLVTLSEHLKNQTTYLAQLMDSAVTTQVKDQVEIIREKSKLRHLRVELKKAIHETDTGDMNAKDISEILTNAMYQQYIPVNMVTDSELMAATLDMIEQNYKNKGGTLGIPTGYQALDKAFNGFKKQNLYIIAGRPGMGKSAFAVNVQQNMSAYRNIYFSLEMGKEELGLRRLALKSFIDGGNLERGNMSDEEWAKMSQKAGEIAEGKGLTTAAAGLTLFDIKSQCKKAQLQGGLDCIIIDHVGLINMKGLGKEPREQYTNLFIELKRMAKDFDIPILALHQLSRACETRQNKRPILSDLKETSGAEENADVVLMFYRDEYYNENTSDKNIIEVNIAKQRNGRTGTVKLAWLPQYQKIADLTRREELK
jgi:replicative DNA helicase